MYLFFIRPARLFFLLLHCFFFLPFSRSSRRADRRPNFALTSCTTPRCQKPSGGGRPPFKPSSLARALRRPTSLMVVRLRAPSARGLLSSRFSLPLLTTFFFSHSEPFRVRAWSLDKGMDTLPPPVGIQEVALNCLLAPPSPDRLRAHAEDSPNFPSLMFFPRVFESRRKATLAPRSPSSRHRLISTPTDAFANQRVPPQAPFPPC